MLLETTVFTVLLLTMLGLFGFSIGDFIQTLSLTASKRLVSDCNWVKMATLWQVGASERSDE